MNSPPYPLNQWPSFLRRTLLAAASTVLAAGLLNVCIDPLGVFGSPTVAGINAIKPHLDHHHELARWRAASRVCAKVGIFGNSRAEIGFDPESQFFKDRQLSAFNHAIAGTWARTTQKQLDWLSAIGCKPDTLILGVEFFDFLGGFKSTQMKTPGVEPVPYLDRHFFAETVFSINGVKDSLTTLLVQHSPYPAMTTAKGFNPLYEYIPEAQRFGQYAMFRQRAEENIKNWARKPPRITPVDGTISDDESALDAILSSAATGNRSKVFIVIYPYHAQIRLALQRMGLGGLFDKWRQLIVDVAARHSGAQHTVEVWDFSGISDITMEPIPARGDRKTQLAWYWEAGHFKKDLGNKIIGQLLGDENGFGINLDTENIAAIISQDRVKVESLIANKTPLLKDIDEILAKQKAK